MTRPAFFGRRGSNLAFRLLVLTLPAFFLYAGLVRWLTESRDLSWALTDLMINYQGGYVRRGLIGEMLFGVSTAGVDPLVALNGVALSLIVLSLCAVVVSLRQRLSTLPFDSLLLLALSPGLFVFVGNDYLAFGRKDPLLLLPLWIHLEVIWSGRGKDGGAWYLKRFLLYVAPAAILVAHVHEAVIFTLPVHFWLGYRCLRGQSQRLSIMLVALGVVLLGMFPAIVAKGDLEVARKICLSWAQVGISMQCYRPPAAIGAFTWDLSKTMSLVWTIVAHPASLLKWGCLALLTFGGLYLAAVRAGVSRRWIGTCMAVVFVCCAPMFVIGYDWGRWLSLGSFVFVLLAFHPAAETIGAEYDRAATPLSPASAFLVVALLVASAIALLPHCCVEEYDPFGGIGSRLRAMI
jgi:hypothetical protein